MTSNERERIDSRLVWLERGIVVAGGVVVVGLLLEYSPEISNAVKARRIFPEEVIGGILVTVGVFFEVLLGIFVTKYARRSQELADSLISETNERAARAEQAAAEANLARVKMEQRMKP